MDSAIENSMQIGSEVLRKQNFCNISSLNVTQNPEDIEKAMRRATGVVLGIGSITLSASPSLAVAVGSVIYNGSKMNRKSEKLMIERLEAETRFIRMGLFADALGVIRNSAKVAMDGFNVLPGVFGPIRLLTNIIGIPLKLFLKVSSENQKRFLRMQRPEQTFEAASLGVYMLKLQILLEELSRLVG
jgi:hypothetical protein